MYSALCWPFHTVAPGGYVTPRARSSIGHSPCSPPIVHARAAPPSRVATLDTASASRSENSADVSPSSSCAWFTSASHSP